MGLFTSGVINVRAVKLRTDLSLEEIRRRAATQAYTQSGDSPTRGWGSSDDDDAAVNAPVFSRVAVGSPSMLPEQDGPDLGIPSRLRMRLYWDKLDRKSLRNLGNAAAWDRTHNRNAADVVIFDDGGGEGKSVLISTRETTSLRSEVFPALQNLIDNGDSVITENIAESLEAELFTWLLWRFQQGPAVPIGDSVNLEAIDAISSRDRLLRGARFTDQATLQRIEVAALIAMGETQFGPAKVGLAVTDLDLTVEVDLYPDGGFQPMRTSEYGLPVPSHLLGHKLIEDMWSIVLPRIRRQFNLDEVWRAQGTTDIRRLAVEAIRSILPDDMN